MKQPSKKLVRRAVLLAMQCDITHAKLKKMGFTFSDGGIAVLSRTCRGGATEVKVRLTPTYPESVVYDIISWEMRNDNGKVFSLRFGNDNFQESRVFKMKHIRDFCKFAFC